MNETLNTNEETNQENTTAWENLADSSESWEEHLAKAQELMANSNSTKVNLAKPRVKFRDENGQMIERDGQLTKTIYSLFNRYPAQQSLAETMMGETYKDGKPLKVLNIGVAQGQEALSYVQMAANTAGENNIKDALDLELVEYATDIPLIDRGRTPDNISSTSYDYLARLYDTPKAHFDTPFQGFVQELNENNEKRDVVLFNNVIQHLDYSAPQEEMLKDMQNLADVVADNGLLCMTCEPSVLDRHQNVAELIHNTEALLEKSNFTKVSDGIYRKNGSPQQVQ